MHGHACMKNLVFLLGLPQINQTPRGLRDARRVSLCGDGVSFEEKDEVQEAIGIIGCGGKP